MIKNWLIGYKNSIKLHLKICQKNFQKILVNIKKLFLGAFFYIMLVLFVEIHYIIRIITLMMIVFKIWVNYGVILWLKEQIFKISNFLIFVKIYQISNFLIFNYHLNKL